MNTDLELGLRAAAEDAPTGACLSEQVLGRAARRRRNRHRVTAAAILAVGVTAATTVDLPGENHGSVPFPSTGVAYAAEVTDAGTVVVGPAGSNCSGGSARVITPSEMPAALRPVLRVPSLTLQSVFVRADKANCGTAARPLAIARVEPGGHVAGTFLLTGPLPTPAQLPAGATTNAQARGTSVTVVQRSSGDVWATWQEPGGKAWVVEGSGMSQADVLGDVTALRLGDNPSLEAPAGWTVLPPVPAVAAGAETNTWQATYRFPGARGEDQVEVAAQTAAGAGLSPGAGCRAVDVDGASGVACSNGSGWGSGLQILQWRPAGGRSMQVETVDHRFDPASTPGLSDAQRGDQVVAALVGYARGIEQAADDSAEAHAAQ